MDHSKDRAGAVQQRNIHCELPGLQYEVCGGVQWVHDPAVAVMLQMTGDENAGWQQSGLCGYPATAGVQ